MPHGELRHNLNPFLQVETMNTTVENPHTTVPRVVRALPPRTLRPHPRHAELAGESTKITEGELKASMAANGLTEPVEITPDKVIVCGHRRVAAAISLGWKVIDCWERDDLASDGEPAIVRRMMEDNMLQRPLSKLLLGRACLTLDELADEHWRSQGRAGLPANLSTDLWKMVGGRDKATEPWRHLANQLPPAYDALLDIGQVTLAELEQITSLPPLDIINIAERCYELIASESSLKESRRQIKSCIVDYFVKCTLPTKEDPLRTWLQPLLRVTRALLRAAPSEITNALQQKPQILGDAGRGFAVVGRMLPNVVDVESHLKPVAYRPQQLRDLQQAACLLSLMLSMDPANAPREETAPPAAEQPPVRPK